MRTGNNPVGGRPGRKGLGGKPDTRKEPWRVQGNNLVAVAHVPMPNGEKRSYMDMGKEGFARILARIKAEKALIKETLLLEQRGKASWKP